MEAKIAYELPPLTVQLKRTIEINPASTPQYVYRRDSLYNIEQMSTTNLEWKVSEWKHASKFCNKDNQSKL